MEDDGPTFIVLLENIGDPAGEETLSSITLLVQQLLVRSRTRLEVQHLLILVKSRITLLSW